jgi:septal ring factor EnvC (AmiA/AmiB activator)
LRPEPRAELEPEDREKKLRREVEESKKKPEQDERADREKKLQREVEALKNQVKDLKAKLHASVMLKNENEALKEELKKTKAKLDAEIWLDNLGQELSLNGTPGVESREKKSIEPLTPGRL